MKKSRLSSSIEIIPYLNLSPSVSNSKSKVMDKQKASVSGIKFRKSLCNKEEMNITSCIVDDDVLTIRIREYLNTNKRKVFIDVDDMANSIRHNYKEYCDINRREFKSIVLESYHRVMQNYKGLSNQPSPESRYNSSFDAEPENSGLNGELLKMYKRRNEFQDDSSDQELINISSDEETSKTDETKLNANITTTMNNDKIVEFNTIPNTLASLTKTIANTNSESPKEKKKINDNNGNTSEAVIKKNTKKREREKDNTHTLAAAKKFKGIAVLKPSLTFANVAGNDKVLESVCKLLLHLKNTEIFKELGVPPPRGILLHGPPGCGKTLLTNAIAGELNVPLLSVAAPELVAGVSGESESRIRDLFEQATAIAPCILFFDEIDSIAPHRATAQREMEKRIVTQLLLCIDELGTKENGDKVLIIGATNRPDSLDPALRRAGRFDREVSLGIPDKDARAKILGIHTEKVKLASDVNLKTIAELSPGYVGADLIALVREAAIASLDRTIKEIPCSELNEKSLNESPTNGDVSPSTKTESQVEPHSTDSSSQENRFNNKDSLSNLSILLALLRSESIIDSERLSSLRISHRDFEAALRIVQPSAKREGFATVPDVTWEDIGSLQDIRQELQMAILAPVHHADHFTALGLTAATGVLLCGPPGCGKTLLAKAIANEAGINFISVKGPELLNMYVGESEKAVRQCFMRARNSVPCVIFFDELDALCPKRTEGDNSATSRVVNQLLTEMDGVEGRQGVFLMAASNRPDIIDPAVLRPGRLDKILYVGLPTALDRIDILRALTKNGTKPKLATDVSIEEIGKHSCCEGYTGADLAALIREAGTESLRDIMSGKSAAAEICMKHFIAAFQKIRPSVREKDIKHYEKLRKLYSVVKKNSEDVPMETPIDTNPVDTNTIEAMETELLST